MDEKNVYCEDPYEKSFQGFQRSKCLAADAPNEDAPHGWDIVPIKNDYQVDAKRNGRAYDIPTEKREALALLDKELATHTQVDDNEDAQNKLDATLHWLRKRQQDTMALENRQMTYLYDIDCMTDEIERLDRLAHSRDKAADKLKKETIQYNNSF